MTRLPERLAAISARLELEQTDSFHEGLTLGLGRPYKLINSSFDLHQTTHHDPDTLFDMPVETCWTPSVMTGNPVVCCTVAMPRPSFTFNLKNVQERAIGNAGKR